jgi:hypothetical protein
MTQVQEQPTAQRVAPAEPTSRRALPFGAATDRHISRREVLLVALAGVLLSLVMNWPLPAHLGSHIGEDLGDPVRTAWQVAWEGHALLHQPLHIYQANAFWPRANTLAFSDSLFGYMPAAVLGTGVKAAIVRYNLLFLFTYALAFAGAYLLARELGLRPFAAVVAGVAFAYAPFKLTMNGHLHVISSGGIPLALFFLARGYRRRDWRFALAGWLVASWQLTLGFTLGLQLAYLLAGLGAIVAVLWWRAGRPELPRKLLVATAVGGLLFAGVGLTQARPYLKISHQYDRAQRSSSDIRKYSAPPKAFVSAAPESRVWGGATKGVRDTLASPNEQDQFPGLTIFALAVVGAVAGTALTKRFRIGLAVAVVVVAIFSLGYGIFDGHLTYRLLVNYAPGFHGIRTPGRLVTLTSLGLAILAAAGAQRLLGAAAARRGAYAALGVAAACLAGVLIEGRGTMPNPAVPPIPPGVAGAPGPQLHLPTNAAFDRVYMLWSVDGFPKIANGTSTFGIQSLDDLRTAMGSFPDGRTVAQLRRMGIRTVFLHTKLEHYPIPRKYSRKHPSDTRAAVRRPVTGLPVTRTRIGPTIRYDLRPANG